MKGYIKRVLLGIACGNALGAALITLSVWYLSEEHGGNGALILADFVIIPTLIGLTNAYFLRKDKVGAGRFMLYGLYDLIIIILGAALFMGEGYICIIIVSPLIYFFLMLGILTGRKLLFPRFDERANLSVVAALGSLLVLNLVTASPSESSLVSDSIVIQASPDEVWKHVVSFEPITEKPDYWLFRLGLPSPVQSTAEGNFVGAWRKCIFSSGIVFEERISELEPGNKLTFDITKQPDDPELIGHLNLLKGQFVLKDNGDGTTTLIGNSWYELKIKPPLYFNLWADSIVRNVHLEVMAHIKALSERKQASV
ncbi:hypothetical protein [Paenibacillus sp. R14(2021)]|uniref:hypothetical protein n=1 Tax=Paenibacillus sp. R14(2021) TaxID=2859228 RepID=UPI001C6126D6|nr:hypothetical protein [Paenibacillus sp. R14(2021)]